MASLISSYSCNYKNKIGLNNFLIKEIPSAMNNTHGKHLILELSNCPAYILDSLEHLDPILSSGITLCGASILNKASHKFQPSGLSMLFLLSESHLSIHTWPEKGYASADMYTCGNCDPSVICDHLRTQLKQQYQVDISIHATYIVRGIPDESNESNKYYHSIRERF